MRGGGLRVGSAISAVVSDVGLDNIVGLKMTNQTPDCALPPERRALPK